VINITIDQLEVTLKMLDIYTSRYNSNSGFKVLHAKLINLELKDFIKNLLEQNNIQYHINDYTPICCDIYIEIEEIKNGNR
jgi:hypothetical protein